MLATARPVSRAKGGALPECAPVLLVSWCQHLYLLFYLDAKTAPALLADALGFVGLPPGSLDAAAVVAKKYNAPPTQLERYPNLALSAAVARRVQRILAPFNRELSRLLGAPLHPAWGVGAATTF